MAKQQDVTIRLISVKPGTADGEKKNFHAGALKLLYFFLYLAGSFSLSRWFSTLFELEIAPSVLALATLGLGSWYFLVYLTKKTRYICVPLSLGILTVLAFLLRETLYLGCCRILNTASRYILDYYNKPLGFLPGEPDPRALLVTVLFLQALGMFWLGSSALRGRSGSMLLSGVLLLSMGLMVNRFPEEGAVFLWAAVCFSLRAAGRSEEAVRIPMALPGVLITVFAGLMVLLCWREIAPRLNPVLEKHYTAFRGFQRDLEENVRDLFQGVSSGGWQGMVQNGVLTNRAPAGGKGTALTLTVETQPEQNIYLKGFTGNLYQGSYWEEISDEEFQEAMEEMLSRGDFQEILNTWDYTDFSYENVQEYLAFGPYELRMAGDPDAERFSIEYKDTPGDYVYAPYFSRVEGDSLAMRGDVELLRNGAEQIRGEFYPELPELSDVLGFSSSLYVPEILGYMNYLWEQYLYIPSTGLEELQDYWTGILKEFQAERGHYPNLTETTSLIRETLSSCSYSRDLESLPEDEDFVQYFLFDQKRGFCTHFASAAVLLYRMTGYQARYAAGYIARPEEFRENGEGGWTAEVPKENAHAWVEVYQNDGTGWLPVEMTPGYGNIQAGEEGEETQTAPSVSPAPETSYSDSENMPGGADDSRVEIRARIRMPAALWIFLLILLTVLLLLLLLLIRRQGILWARERRFRNPNGRQAVRDMVREADQMLRDSGFCCGSELSDQEYARRVQEAYPGLEKNSFERLVSLGERASYGREKISLQAAAECHRIYRLLEAEITRDRGRGWKLWWRFIKCR